MSKSRKKNIDKESNIDNDISLSSILSNVNKDDLLEFLKQQKLLSNAANQHKNIIIPNNNNHNNITNHKKQSQELTTSSLSSSSHKDNTNLKSNNKTKQTHNDDTKDTTNNNINHDDIKSENVSLLNTNENSDHSSPDDVQHIKPKLKKIVKKQHKQSSTKNNNLDNNNTDNDNDYDNDTHSTAKTKASVTDTNVEEISKNHKPSKLTKSNDNLGNNNKTNIDQQGKHHNKNKGNAHESVTNNNNNNTKRIKSDAGLRREIYKNVHANENINDSIIKSNVEYESDPMQAIKSYEPFINNYRVTVDRILTYPIPFSIKNNKLTLRCFQISLDSIGDVKLIKQAIKIMVKYERGLYARYKNKRGFLYLLTYNNSNSNNGVDDDDEEIILSLCFYLVHSVPTSIQLGILMLITPESYRNCGVAEIIFQCVVIAATRVRAFINAKTDPHNKIINTSSTTPVTIIVNALYNLMPFYDLLGFQLTYETVENVWFCVRGECVLMQYNPKYFTQELNYLTNLLETIDFHSIETANQLNDTNTATNNHTKQLKPQKDTKSNNIDRSLDNGDTDILMEIKPKTSITKKRKANKLEQKYDDNDDTHNSHNHSDNDNRNTHINTIDDIGAGKHNIDSNDNSVHNPHQDNDNTAEMINTNIERQEVPIQKKMPKSKSKTNTNTQNNDHHHFTGKSNDIDINHSNDDNNNNNNNNNNDNNNQEMSTVETEHNANPHAKRHNKSKKHKSRGNISVQPNQPTVSEQNHNISVDSPSAHIQNVGASNDDVANNDHQVNNNFPSPKHEDDRNNSDNEMESIPPTIQPKSKPRKSIKPSTAIVTPNSIQSSSNSSTLSLSLSHSNKQNPDSTQQLNAQSIAINSKTKNSKTRKTSNHTDTSNSGDSQSTVLLQPLSANLSQPNSSKPSHSSKVLSKTTQLSRSVSNNSSSIPSLEPDSQIQHNYTNKATNSTVTSNRNKPNTTKNGVKSALTTHNKSISLNNNSNNKANKKNVEPEYESNESNDIGNDDGIMNVSDDSSGISVQLLSDEIQDDSDDTSQVF